MESSFIYVDHNDCNVSDQKCSQNPKIFELNLTAISLNLLNNPVEIPFLCHAGAFLLELLN